MFDLCSFREDLKLLSLEAFHAYVTCLREDNRTVNTQTEAYRKYVAWLGGRQQSTLV